MNERISLIVYPTKNLEKSKLLYTRVLGVDPYADQPYYVGYKVGGMELGLDPHAQTKGLSGPVTYVTVKDIKAALDAAVEAGAIVVQGVTDLGYDKNIAIIKDDDGSLIGLLQPKSDNMLDE